MMQNYKHDVSPDWGLATQMVHGGLTRSQHAETAEAIYMTSGYVYQSAEEAQAAFDNSKPRFVYGRFGNPTVAMFEERMALLEGAEAARARGPLPHVEVERADLHGGRRRRATGGGRGQGPSVPSTDSSMPLPTPVR